MKHTARIGGKENTGSLPPHERLRALLETTDLTKAYLTASQKLIEAFPSKENSDNVLIPVFFLQRHALELILKDCLLAIYQIRLLENQLDKTSQKPYTCQTERATKSHNLSVLFTDLVDALFIGNHSTSESIVKLSKLVNTFQEIDKKGTAARYDLVSKDSCEKIQRKPIELNVIQHQADLEEVYRYLFGDERHSHDGIMRDYHGYISALNIKLLENA